MANRYVGRVCDEVTDLEEARGFVYLAQNKIPAGQLRRLYEEIILPIHKEATRILRVDIRAGLMN